MQVFFKFLSMIFSPVSYYCPYYVQIFSASCSHMTLVLCSFLSMRANFTPIENSTYLFHIVLEWLLHFLSFFEKV
jgi:hypothetical protein